MKEGGQEIKMSDLVAERKHWRTEEKEEPPVGTLGHIKNKQKEQKQKIKAKNDHIIIFQKCSRMKEKPYGEFKSQH